MAASSIEVRGLKKYFGDVKAVDGISFNVEEGIIFGMLGPNGAGKTTTIETIVGLYERDAGEIDILGLDPEKDGALLKQKVGVQLQSPALFKRLTVEELLKLFASFYKQPLSISRTLAMVGLENKSGTLTTNLSGGQRHRLAVALAIISNGDIIFLDEPTTGLDPQARRKLWSVIRELKNMGKTIFLTTHYMEEAEKLCDDLLIIDQGRIIAAGSPGELIAEHFSENTIEFKNTGLKDEQIDKFNDLVSVAGVKKDRENILIYSRETADTISELMKFTEESKLEIDDLHIRKPTLEDLFLKLTGRMIRE